MYLPLSLSLSLVIVMFCFAAVGGSALFAAAARRLFWLPQLTPLPRTAIGRNLLLAQQRLAECEIGKQQNKDRDRDRENDERERKGERLGATLVHNFKQDFLKY